jgi:ATPase
MKKIVPDTSVIIDGRITEMIESGEIKEAKIYLHVVTIGELEHQANLGKETGFSGLEEIKKLRKLAEEKKVEIEYCGERSTELMIKGAKLGEIDAEIRKLAKEKGAILITSDKVMNEVAKAEGIETIYLEPKYVVKELPFKEFITKDTISLHLKEDTQPIAKVGKPGEIKVITLGKKMNREELEEMIREIVEIAKRDEKSYFEIDSKGASVIQMREYRIAITRPPFSDGLEITIVRPIAKVRLEDYKLSSKLLARLEYAEGILICGPPGSGKSTFAAALAEEYLKRKKIVKTLESPRDLQVPDEVTQYGPLEGSFEKTADILLLVRPDYTIYDEMRKTSDFKIYCDMRLSGIGMIGVVHSSKPIEAIQRFIGRVDLGMIPQIVDTIIFIKDGTIRKVLTTTLVVKVPRGMRDIALARPVVEIRDFETEKLEYEIYKFADETVCVKVKK